MAKKKKAVTGRSARTSEQTIRRYVLLPARGITSASTPAAEAAGPFLSSLSIAKATSVTAKGKMRVVDSIADNGAKLVEMTEEGALKLRAAQPGLRVITFEGHGLIKA